MMVDVGFDKVGGSDHAGAHRHAGSGNATVPDRCVHQKTDGVFKLPFEIRPFDCDFADVFCYPYWGIDAVPDPHIR